MRHLIIAVSILLLSAPALLSQQAHDGLVRIATACMRANPGHASELVSQAVMGTPLRLLEKDGGWWLVETPEGYRGYMISNSIQALDSIAMEQWRQAPRVMFTDVYTGRVVSCDGLGAPVSDIQAGSVLQVTGHSVADSVDVRLPDGRSGRLATASVTPLEELGTADPDTDAIIAMARALMGVSYLWGGTSTAAMDCSGLAKICYLNQGVILQRDAGEQAATGTILGTDYREYQRGDLVFFKSETTGNIVHVGIYDRDGLYIHASGRVRVNSLDPASPLYIPSNIIASASRITGKLGTPGIIPLPQSIYFQK